MNQAPENYLPSVIPELKTVNLTIEFYNDEAAPEVGMFIVSVGKNRNPGTVYQVISQRAINSKRLFGPNGFNRKWAFQCVKCPELLKDVRVNFRFEARIFGRKEQVITIMWNSRNKKK